jgi:hypothetical protein
MTTHARLPPSARYRWAACPASVNAIAKYEGKGGSSPSAIDGTHSHTLLEHCIKNNREPHSYIGLLLQDHEGMFGVDKDRADRVKIATDYIKTKVVTGVKVIAEQRVHPDALVGRDDMGGTVDVQIINGDHIEIIDYKDGMNPVKAEDNQQLEQYAYGILAGYLSAPQPRMFSKLTMTIVQPKIALKGGEPISSHSLDVTDLLGERLEKIIAEAAATDDPNAPFIPGDKQCSYCINRGNCSSFNSWSLEKAGIKFEDMNFIQDAAKKEPTEMTDEQLRELVEAAPMIRKMIESAEEEVLRRIQSGHPVTGLKVVRGSGRRQWGMPDEGIEAALKKMRVPKDVIWQTSLISPAQLEKAVWEKRDGTTVQLDPKQLAKVESELITKSEGKLTVAPESDRRAAVDFGNIEKMFEAVPAAPEQPSWLS